MIRLSARLAFAGGRASAVAVVLTALAVAVGTAIVLFALSIEPALEVRYARSAWRDTSFHSVDWAAMKSFIPGDQDLLMSTTEDEFEGQAITRTDVAVLGAHPPIPPGLSAWPRTGEAYVSPALQRIIAATPPDQLGDRFGRVVGTLREASLRAPDELAVVVGLPVDALQARDAALVTELSSDTVIPSIWYWIQAFALVTAALVLTPVVVFIATATRLTAASRERRLALLRLVGATSRQAAVLAAGDAALATVPGAVVGVALFYLLRPLAARIQLDHADWFVDAIAPPIWQAMVVVMLVPMLGVATAVIALRRTQVSPLGVVRHHRPGRPTLVRLIPIGVSVAALLVGLDRMHEPHGVTSDNTFVLAVAFVGIIVGVAIAGPWLTALLGTALGRLSRGPSTLIAARRLTDAPSTSFGAVSGIVMASFVAALLSVFLSYSAQLVRASNHFPVRSGSVEAGLFQPFIAGSPLAVNLVAQLHAVAGTRGVLPYEEVTVTVGDPDPNDDNSVPTARGWIVDCGDLVSTLALPVDCTSARAWAAPGLDVSADQPSMVAQSLGELGFGWDSGGSLQMALPNELQLTSIGGSGEGYSGPDLFLDRSLLSDRGDQYSMTGIIVAGNGSQAFEEQARTLIDAAVPGARVRTLAEKDAYSTGTTDELGRLLMVAMLATLLIAGCSLAVSLAAGMLDRRRPLALLRLAGMPVSRLRAAMLLEAGLPLIVTGALSMVLGIVIGQQVFAAVSQLPAPSPDQPMLIAFAVGMALALLVVLATLPLVGPITSTEATRFE